MTQRLDYASISPNGFKALLGVHNFVRHSDLPPELVELVYLRVSQINGCAFCIDMHSGDLLKSNVPTAKLLLLSAWREAGPMFSEKERAALAWAETVTLVAQTEVPDSEYEAAKSQFSEKDLVELTVAICGINAFNRLGVSFRKTPASVLALA